VSDGDAALAAMIARVQAFGKDATRDAAREAAPLVDAEVKRTAAAGTDPYGEPLPPKRDGSRALLNAAENVSAVAAGPTIKIRTHGAYAIHFFKKIDQRRIVPSKDKPMPKAIIEALKEGARRAFAKAMGQ
jgi:hypothetical protein